MNKLGVALEMLLTPLFWVSAVAGILVAAGLAKPTATRLRRGRAAAFLAWCSLLLILLLTFPLVPPQGWLEIPIHWDATAASAWFMDGWANVSMPDLGLEGLANLALYFIAGYSCAKLVDRPLLVAASLSVGSFLIETVQAGLGDARIGDPRDLVNNILGAFLGVGMAALLTKPSGASSASVVSSGYWPKRRVAKTLAVVMASALCLAGFHVVLRSSADRRQALLFETVRTAYAGTTIPELKADSARLGNEPVIGRAGIQPDYFGMTDHDAAQARFGVEGTAYRRCVVVDWRGDAPAAFSGLSGDECLTFRDIGLGLVDE